MRDHGLGEAGIDADEEHFVHDRVGTGKIADDKIAKLVEKHFDLRPKGIIHALDLLRPIYLKTAAYGHFGRDEPEFTWEATDKAAALKADAGIK